MYFPNIFYIKSTKEFYRKRVRVELIMNLISGEKFHFSQVILPVNFGISEKKSWAKLEKNRSFE